MIIELGELLIVYYEFLKCKKKMSKEEMKRGLMILIFEVYCFVIVFLLDVGRDVIIMCKVSINFVFLFN